MSRPSHIRRLDIYVAFAFAAADVLLEIDKHGQVVFAVGAARALLGWPARVLSGMRLDDLIAPADHGRAAAALAPQPELHLRADRATRYEKVTEIMAMAQHYGISRIAFVTEGKAQSAP